MKGSGDLGLQEMDAGMEAVRDPRYWSLPGFPYLGMLAGLWESH